MITCMQLSTERAQVMELLAFRLQLPAKHSITKRAAHGLTASPTDPSPKIATDEPGSTLADLHAAPTPELLNDMMYKAEGSPVLPPQLRRQASLGGTAGSILTTWFMSTTVYSLKLDTARRSCSGFPCASQNRVVPSRRIPGPMMNGTEAHMLFCCSDDVQLPQLSHCPRNVGTTESPAAKPSTSFPTLSTTLHAHKAQSIRCHELINYKQGEIKENMGIPVGLVS
ncbi:hypothetical protein U9M48_006391 [Paspalum notatum var. saurae]|uniref:Uncharacterized protein n=1 Tax=Paspalum notatum var. saurae TaxID=547442 RepID=A0AAQ3PNX5_PASNO